MALTLEQLDQFGTLEQVPYSFDHNWEVDEVCGDWRLEDMDSLGNLDTLTVSFDDPVWLTLCVKFPGAAISASADVVADGSRIRSGEAAVAADATLT